MTTETQKLKLFRAVSEEDFNLELITDNARQVVPALSVLYSDLVQLLKSLDNFDSAGPIKHKWWIARVECSTEQAEYQSQGLYQAKQPILVPDGYIPLEDALIRYSGITQNA